MRTVAALLSCSLLGATIVAAQEKPGAEIGTSLGVTILSQSGTSVTHIGIPAGLGPVAQPSIYATIFVSPSVTIEPQVGFSRISSSGATLTFVDLAGQLGYWFTPRQKASAYLAASLAYQSLSQSSPFGGTTKNSGPGAGGEIGYRIKVGTGFAVRLTARYRRWFSDFKDLNEFGFAIGLGGLIH
jgi:hypothetical protein